MRRPHDGFKKAAEQGKTNAQCELGILFKHGIGVPQSYKEAAVWFKKAANKKT